MNHQSNIFNLREANEPTIPALGDLYFSDRTLGRAGRTFGFCLFSAIMIRWATQPMPNAVPIEKSPFEIWLPVMGPSIALVVAALALLIFLRRHSWIKRVLSEGRIIQGTVEKLDTYERESSHSDTTPAFQRGKTRSYYATVSYLWQGQSRKVRFSLPLSASNYKIFKGKETELVLLDSAPKKPLLRALYAQELRPRKMSWWKWL